MNIRRHGRARSARSGHPHLETEKAWMPGTRPGMTTFGMTFLENQ
jgi:hypothetical protein